MANWDSQPKYATRHFLTLSREELLQESEEDEAEILLAIGDPAMRERHAAFERMLDRDETAERIEV